MSELIELLKPILWVVVAFGIMFGSTILAIVVFAFVKVIKEFREGKR